MTVNVAILCNAVAAVQTIAAVQNQDGSGGGPNVPFSPQNPAGSNSPSTYQGFQIVVTGNPGQTVSATAQIVASNDGVNWSNLTTVAAAGATNTSSGLASNQAPYKYYAAYISAISGTGAKATVTMCS